MCQVVTLTCASWFLVRFVALLLHKKTNSQQPTAEKETQQMLLTQRCAIQTLNHHQTISVRVESWSALRRARQIVAGFKWRSASLSKFTKALLLLNASHRW